jgi:hypothetical protein
MENSIQTSPGMDAKKNDSVLGADKDYGTTETMSSKEEKRLVRKIDFQYVTHFNVNEACTYSNSLMPLLIISYGLQYLDSTT